MISSHFQISLWTLLWVHWFWNWTATQKKKKTSQLTLTPNSASKRRIQGPSKSSLSSVNPPPAPVILNVPVKFREIKVVLREMRALLRSVVLYHLLCLRASSSARWGEKRWGEVGARCPERTADRTARTGGDGVRDKSERVLISASDLDYVILQDQHDNVQLWVIVNDQTVSGRCICSIVIYSLTVCLTCMNL